MVRQVYMDNNATTPLHPEVKRAMVEALEMYGNASSLHGLGRRSREAVEEARSAVASFIGARPEEIIFVGSGSEANNTVLNIAAGRCDECAPSASAESGILTSAIEHPCVLETAECLAARGVEVRIAGVDRFGVVSPEAVDEFLADGRIGLVSIMAANNEIGTLEDIPALAAAARRRGALFHTDAVQAVGKVPVDVGAWGVDFLTVSAHKIYGPKGVGALYVRSGVPFCPMIRGGHQERGRRAGTENVLGIIGLGAAVQAAAREWEEDARRLGELKKRLWEGIEAAVPDVLRNGHPTAALPGTLNVSFPGAEGEAILLYLDLEGIAVSTGSACSTGSLEPSHVLMAIGLGAEAAHGSIRFSLGRENGIEDVEYVLAQLPPVIARIRRMSTAYPGGRS